MPTGYTDTIKDGITFKEFALNCARAFGALILMRDDAASTPIPEQFEPSDYSVKALAKALGEISKLEAMSTTDEQHKAEQWYDEEQARIDKAIDKAADLKAAYKAMLIHVGAWQPPTSEHEGLKKFMRDQIRQSIEFDCGTEYYENSRPIPLDGAAWAKKQMVQLLKDVKYHTKQQAEEVKRTDDRNAWVKALRESLAS